MRELDIVFVEPCHPNYMHKEDRLFQARAITPVIFLDFSFKS